MSADLVEVPLALASSLTRNYGEAGRDWLDAAPRVVAEHLDRWELRLDGAPMHGVVALVLPVTMADGTPAALKLQIDDPDHPGEGAALRTWDGHGAVRLLREDERAGTLLLERLDSGRDLRSVRDDIEAVQITAQLLVRLNAYPAPPGPRRLSEIAAGMLDYAPDAAKLLADPTEARLVLDWAAAVREVAGECGDRLLHWDLHYENVLAGDREEWLAIDPKPLAGDPAFELMPALHNRWDEVLAGDDPHQAVLRRFDAMVEVMSLDRDRAVAWTLGRVLQNSLWTVEDGERTLEAPQVLIAEALTGSR